MEKTLSKKYEEKQKLYKNTQEENPKIRIQPFICSSQGMIEPQSERYIKTLLATPSTKEKKNDNWKRIWNYIKLEIMATIIKYTTTNAIKWNKS